MWIWQKKKKKSIKVTLHWLTARKLEFTSFFIGRVSCSPRKKWERPLSPQHKEWKQIKVLLWWNSSKHWGPGASSNREENEEEGLGDVCWKLQLTTRILTLGGESMTLSLTRWKPLGTFPQNWSSSVDTQGWLPPPWAGFLLGNVTVMMIIQIYFPIYCLIVTWRQGCLDLCDTVIDYKK